MTSKRTFRAVFLISTLVLAFSSLVNARVMGEDGSKSILDSLRVTVDIPDEYYSENYLLRLTVSTSERDLTLTNKNVEATFTLKPEVYEAAFTVKRGELFPKTANPNLTVDETTKDTLKKANEARNKIKSGFWRYSPQVPEPLYINLDNPPLLLKHLAESIKNETLKPESLKDGSFLNRVRELKIVATLLDFVVTKTRYANKDFSELAGESAKRKNDYVEVWSILWDLTQQFAEEAETYPWDNTKNERVQAQELLFKTTKAPSRYDDSGHLVGGEEIEVSVFERLMRSRAALFGSDVGIYEKVHEGASGKDEYRECGKISRVEAFSRLMKTVYDSYRLNIPEAPKKSENKENLLTVGKGTEKADYYKYSLKDLSSLLKYIAENPEVKNFLTVVNKAPGDNKAPDVNNRAEKGSAIQSKAKLLHKYLLARETLANEDEALKVIRHIYDHRKNGAVPTREALLRDPTLSNLYEAATATGESNIDGIWDAQIYLRYLFLLSSYERGGVRVVGTDDVFTLENYAEKAKKLLEQGVEDVLGLQKEGWANKLEDDWQNCFGKDFGTFGRHPRMGEVLPPAPEKLARVAFLKPEEDEELAKFLNIANDIPNDKNTSVQIVSKLIDGGVNVLYYKSYTRLLERYYRPKSSGESSNFNFELYYEIVDSLNQEFKKQMTRVFPESGFDSLRHDDYRAKAEAARDALDICDAGSAAERALLTNDYDYLPRRARNLYMTQVMVASSRLNVYGDSSLAQRREEEARAAESGEVKKERSARAQRRDYFQGKPTYISLSGVSIGDFPILDLDSLPNYSLDQYVEFVNYVLVPYKKELKEYKDLALAYCNSDFDVEISEIEIEAADTAVRIADLGVEIANKWVEIALIEEEIAGLGEELANLEKERDTIALEGKMKALELAKMTSEALDLQVRGLTDFIENQALPKLEETKESLDRMCKDLIKQAEKIEEAQRKAAKKKRLFGALRAVVTVVGVAAAVFTGGASLAVTTFVTTATTVANSAINIAEAVDSGGIKFNNLANAAQSLTYIGKEAGAAMAACNIPQPEFIKNAREFIGDGLEKYNQIKTDLIDKYKEMQTAVVGNYEEFKDGAKTVVDSIKSEIDSKTSDLNAIGAAAQIRLLNGLDSLKNGDAFNTLKGLRDGSFGRVVRSLSNVGDQVDDVAKKFEQLKLDSVAVSNLQGSLDKLAKNGLALKSNVLELKDQLPVELRDGIGAVGEKVADDLRVYIKNNAEVLFDDLIAQSSKLRESCEEKLRDARETLGKDAKDLLAELEKAPEALRGVLDDAKKRVEGELAKLGLEELFDGADWSLDKLITEVQEGLIADVDSFFQDYAADVAEKLDAELDQLVKGVASDYQKSVDEVVDSFLSEFDQATAKIDRTRDEVALFVDKSRDDVATAIQNTLAFGDLETIVKDAVKDVVEKVRNALVVDLKNALREEIASSVAAQKDNLTRAVDSFQRDAQTLKDDMESFVKSGVGISEFKNRLREDIEKFDPSAVKDKIGVLYELCADDLKFRAVHFQKEKIQRTVDSVRKDCQGSVDKIRNEIDNRVANATNAIIQVKNDFKMALNTYDESRAALLDASARFETLVVNVGERVQDLPKKTGDRLSTFATNLPGFLMPNLANLTLRTKDVVEESQSTMIGRAQIAADRVVEFKKSAVAIVDDVKASEASENFLNREISVDSHNAVEATIGDILRGPEGDNLVDFLVDAVRMNADMRVDDSGSVVLATETLGSRGEELKRRADIMNAAQSKLKSIISDYTRSMQAINEELKRAVDQAGSDPGKLRKVAKEDVQKAKDKFVACFDALKDKLNIMLGEQAEAKAKVEIAQIDVEVAKKQLTIDDVKIAISKLKVKKAQKETEARKMEVTKAEMERDLSELNRAATRVRQEKAEFNNAVFTKKLQQWSGLPRTLKGEVNVEELKKQCLENNFHLEAPASTSVLGILDPTLPEEEVLNSVLADFAGVLKWMKILNVVQRGNPWGVNSPYDDISEDTTSQNASETTGNDKNSQSTKIGNRFNSDDHDYMWFANEFCRLYADEGTTKERLFDTMQVWLTKIQHDYKRSGRDRQNAIFLTETVEPNFPKGSYYETRYFVHFDKNRYPGLFDENDVNEVVKRIDSMLSDETRLARELGTSDDLSAKKELLQKEKAKLETLLKTDAASWKLLSNGARYSWYYENIEADDVASRIVDEKLGAPIAKIVVWFRPDGANSFYDVQLDGKFGHYLGQETFTPYAMVNWIEIVSRIEPADSMDFISGLRFIVVDPEGVWTVAPREEPGFSSQVVKKSSEFNDQNTTDGFDKRAAYFKLREFNGLWKIYIYDANRKNDPYFYGDRVDDPRVRASRLQRWQIYFRYVKANK